jgi:hypothetical protein
MITILAIVPKPGFSRNGIHKSNTTVLIVKVEKPREMSNLFETPSARTVHGAFPVPLCTKSESPRPKINKPKQRINVRFGDKSQR